MIPERLLLPEYPRTKHLPWQPNEARDDLIATEEEAAVIFSAPSVTVEEKLDGANVGIMQTAEGPILRNRNHILRKSFAARTPAKMQFAALWNWYYENEEKFAALGDAYGGAVSVYGEWLYARHSIEYDALPSLFIPFDLYDPQEGKFVDPLHARFLLTAAGFDLPTLVDSSPQLKTKERLVGCLDGASTFSSRCERREGLYVKVGDGEWLTARFKIVRPGFIQGEHWNKREIQKNRLAR